MFEYRLNGNKYKIYTKYIPLIYDYDYTYCEKLGVNKRTNNELFIYLNGEKLNYKYDKVSEFKDFFKLLEDIQDFGNMKYFVNECMKSSGMMDIIDNIYGKIEKKKNISVPKGNIYNCDKRIF